MVQRKHGAIHTEVWERGEGGISCFNQFIFCLKLQMLYEVRTFLLILLSERTINSRNRMAFSDHQNSESISLAILKCSSLGYIFLFWISKINFIEKMLFHEKKKSEVARIS